ncbi:motile sperm domain-containing protein 2-like [Hylaeus anthracinus]|uniref:motile sperm domain-containing protein 2-like n=1 Tax=Hylaeus anthracinus TaxID=313031 RepID=UPI0023B8D544|nr:motile sperm domain-containing protein 2-like [Hylaeus anthracinus]
MEVRMELISELREKFFKKLDDEGPPDPRGFHPADIAKIMENDWLRRFLEHNECNMIDSLNMLWETCTWRRKFEVHEITEETVKREYLEDGICFIHGKDREGKALFIIRCKLHTRGSKDFNEVRRVIVYWFERLERQTNGDQFSLFFDMADTGIMNMDMELVKYLISLCKNYYPNFLNYIIIFELPWLLNATFKIIKSWLPPKALPKMKFIHRSTIHTFVEPSDILTCWGGTNDYTFRFVPEAQNNMDATMNGKLDNKKVHFAEGSPMTEQSPDNFGDQPNEDELLLIDPKTITFNKKETELVGTITLRNIRTEKPLSYKIKTTSPEKFRVRPSLGVLLPQEQRTVSVVLQPGYNVRGLLHNDRFLVMCLPLKDANMSPQELATLWKSETPREQHRLRCCDGESENNETQKSHSILSSGMSDNGRTVDTLFYKISQLKESNAKLHNDIVTLKYLVLFSIIMGILLAVMVVYILRIDIQNSMDQEACHIPRGI